MYNQFPNINLVLLAGILLTLPLAFLLNSHLQKRCLAIKNYVWGYTQGLAGILAGITGIAYVLYGMYKFPDAPPGIINYLLAASALAIVFGIFTLRRYRIPFILLSLTTLNPVLWIINSIYIWNRWKELKYTTTVALESHTAESPFTYDETVEPKPVSGKVERLKEKKKVKKVMKKRRVRLG